MPPEDAAYLERVRRARDQLAAQLLNQPGVSLIDIGYDPEAPEHPEHPQDAQDAQEPQNHRSAPAVVVRVHLRNTANAEDLAIPAEIDGIPVRVLSGDYRLE